ncbi:TPA: hypothetical protein ACH3X3_003106 [Trebouxia sp. C0006]
MAMNAGTYKAPVTGRTAKKPFFTAKTPKGPGDHMEAPFLFPDRFEAPVASIHFNSLGEPVYGMPERPMSTSVRHTFEKQKADENERAAKRMMEKPGGRRHDAFTDYHQRIQMGDEVHGYEAEARRGMARIQRTHHPIFAGSLETSTFSPVEGAAAPEILAADAAKGPPPQLEPSAEAVTQGSNAMRSRAHDNATGTIASGLDMWHDAHGSSGAARFASHSAWEVQHDQSILQDQARVEAKAHKLDQYRKEAHEVRQLEQDLSLDYPHGLPAGRLRAARDLGLKLGGLGFGFPSSMTDQHTSIMRTMAKPKSVASFRIG